MKAHNDQLGRREFLTRTTQATVALAASAIAAATAAPVQPPAERTRFLLLDYEPVDADKPARLWLRPVVCRGKTLYLTADAQGGEITVCVRNDDQPMVATHARAWDWRTIPRGLATVATRNENCSLQPPVSSLPTTGRPIAAMSAAAVIRIWLRQPNRALCGQPDSRRRSRRRSSRVASCLSLKPIAIRSVPCRPRTGSRPGPSWQTGGSTLRQPSRADDVCSGRATGSSTACKPWTER